MKRMITKKDVVDIVNEAIEEGEIVVGGEQPRLFTPLISKGLNTISFSTNTDNGAFDVTTIGVVDGNEVSSPLTITSELDNKKLVVTSSGENFLSASVEETLKYVDDSQSIVVIDKINESTNYIGLFIGGDNSSWQDYKCLYNGNEIAKGEGNNTYYIPIQRIEGIQQVDVKLIATNSITSNIIIGIFKENSPISVSTGGVPQNVISLTGELTPRINGISQEKITFTSQSLIYLITFSSQVATDDVIDFIIEVESV